LYAVSIVQHWSALGRIVSAAIVAALLVAAGGLALERARFGVSEATAAARVEREIQRLFDERADNLSAIAERVGRALDLIRSAPRDTGAAIELFSVLGDALADPASTGVTVYDPAGMPVAWAGRVFDPPAALDASAPLVLAVGALGPRLMRVEPVIGAPGVRVATIVAEQILAPIDRPPLGDRLVLESSLAPVTLHLGAAVPPGASPAVFSIESHDGGTLADAEVSLGALADGRARWRRATMGAALATFAGMLLVGIGFFIERRRHASTLRGHLAAAAAIAGILVTSRLILRAATAQLGVVGSPVAPVDLFLTALVAAALVWLALDLLEARRLARPRARLLVGGAAGLVALLYLAAGAVDAAVLWVYARFLQSTVSSTTIDLLHFSLSPFDLARLGLAFGLVLLHAAVIWLAVAVIRLPAVAWRIPRGRLPIVAAAAWAAGAFAGVAMASGRDPSIPAAPIAFALAAAGACAFLLPGLRVRTRHGSQSIRLVGSFLVLLVPAMAMYPTLTTFAIQAKEDFIAREYGPQVVMLREDLQRRLYQALGQIDALPSLPGPVSAPPREEAGNRAFEVWSQTDLERFRLTSAVELYGQSGDLVSRFALNLPEYGATTYQPASCTWDVTDDVSPIGASESHVLRASRGLCSAGRAVGGIIVNAMLDYRTLPFISSRSPYLESLRPEREAATDGVSGSDVEFAYYGWSRAPLFASGASVWAIPDALFARMMESRLPFWSRIDRGNEQFRVYFMNDRGGIYALGYPVISAFGHLVNLAELVMLALALLVLLMAGASLFHTFGSHAPATGRALFREIQSSFYRKLRLAFVVGSIFPVFVLAFLTRAYFVNELTAGIEESAARTVTVAQRLVEDYATLQQRGSSGLEALNDDIMVLVSRAIDEDVNFFDRARLQATSALDLYASQLLSTRTPAPVYQRLVLERAPTYVGEQEVGPIRYLIAAAPVRTAGGEGLVTVPVTLRPSEIERQIDELDRLVLFGAILFSLFGGATGYWFAERIAGPVNRLTRATRRIARGDLNARIAATSGDELGRLGQDFNQMAADLERQRTELERTQRLAAWADMARQVAHDIKNPLTPIQLSAEHLRRVNEDHGRPLSPVLDECVTAILGQVRLLRQIAGEFSSFASSPTARPEPTNLPALIEEVVAPYRTGLSGRISIVLEAQDDLPPVATDRTLLARALTNVLENALHAMPGTGELTVATRVIRDRHPAAIIEITDTGVGMDEEALSKIFQPYFSTKATGTGLGLTIAKRNVELNGGTIQVASARGVGTTVTLTLPLAATA
jgi:signal transduction histidine kinase